MAINGSYGNRLVSLYQTALNSVINDPQVMEEIARARNMNPSLISSHDFIREYAWTVFNSGMRMRIIKRRWTALEEAFEYWDPKAILTNMTGVKDKALKVFNNKSKVNAVLKLANLINNEGWAKIRFEIMNCVVRSENGNFYPSPQLFTFLSYQLAWMGPTNRRYLAKNLGFDFAKDDRHLRRLTESYGYSKDAEGVQQFVEEIGKCVNERISVVETVLWNACERGAI